MTAVEQAKLVTTCAKEVEKYEKTHAKMVDKWLVRLGQRYTEGLNKVLEKYPAEVRRAVVGYDDLTEEAEELIIKDETLPE